MQSASSSVILGQSKPSIHSLPHELLVENINYVAFATPFSEGSHYQTLFTMASISHQFRSVLNSAPLLWARAVDFRAPVECIQELLRLSGDSIPFQRPRMPHFHCGLSPQSNEVEVWRMIVSNPRILHRCLSLQVDIADCVWNPILQQTLCDLQIEDIPTLRINFSKCLKPHHRILQTVTPYSSLFKENEIYSHLRSLSLVDGSFELSKSSFPSLQHLSISLQFGDAHHELQNSLMTPKEWISCLNGLPQLRSLRLIDAINQTRPENNTPHPETVAQAYLPQLQCLNIEGRQSGIGPLLRDLRLASTCDIRIKTRVSSHDLEDSSTTNSSISGLMAFLREHYSGEDAANFGSNLCIHASTNSINCRRADLTLANYRNGHAYRVSALDKQQEEQEGAPLFHLTVVTNLARSEDDVFHPYHALFTAMHERLATEGLVVPFASVHRVYYSSSDSNFAESSAQGRFFRTLSSTRRLDVQGVSTLWSLHNMQTSHDIKHGLFPQLEVIGTIGIDFRKRGDEVVYAKTPGMEDIVDFDASQLAARSDSLAHVKGFLKTRVERSLEYVPQILGIEVIRGTGACDLRMMLADVKFYGGEIEVVEVAL